MDHSTVALSKRLIGLRRKMARRWTACQAVDDPQLLAISQELDQVLFQFITCGLGGASPAAGDASEG